MEPLGLAEFNIAFVDCDWFLHIVCVLNALIINISFIAIYKSSHIAKFIFNIYSLFK